MNDKVPADVLQDIEGMLQQGQVLDAIDSLIGQQIIKQLSTDGDTPASVLKVAMEYLKEREYRPASIPKQRETQAKHGDLESKVNWEGLPGMEDLRVPLEIAG